MKQIPELSEEDQALLERETQVSDEKFQELLGYCGKYVDTILDDNPDSVAPVVVIYSRGVSPEGKFLDPVLNVNVLAMPFNSAVEKKAAMYQLGRELATERHLPMAWFLISEAWASTQKIDEPRKYLMPEDDPERRELVICVGASQKGRQPRFAQSQIEVTRSQRNKMHRAGEWETAEIRSARILLHLIEGYQHGTEQLLRSQGIEPRRAQGDAGA